MTRPRRLLRCAPLLALLIPALAGTEPADLPSFQYSYAVPGADLVLSVARGPGGTIHAAGLGSRSVLLFDEAGVPTGSWPVDAAPLHVAVADDGTVWVSTADSADVRSFTPGGAPLVRIPGVSGALANAPGGDVFVASTYAISRFRPDGGFVQEWKFCLTPHSCIGVSVNGIAIGPDTTVYVALDGLGAPHEVWWFRPAGGSGSLPWPYPERSPTSVALEAASGEVYAAFRGYSPAGNGIVKFSAAGDTVGTVSLPYVVLGEMTTDGSGHLHVPFGSEIARFGLGTTPARTESWGSLKARRR